MDIKSILLAIAAALFVWVVFLWLRALRRRPGLDARVITQLEHAGANLARDHPVEFFLYFPSREAADRAAVKVAALGMEVKVSESRGAKPWLVFGTRLMVPREREMARLRTLLDAIAAEERGEYDGWGTPVVK
ncbi:MAG: ribonuclease E inhibitor RraB [Betaproteobacteria bacterium]|nr:ribonuclease E inhibitor RraB [Betaproteobacteria bacterium]